MKTLEKVWAQALAVRIAVRKGEVIARSKSWVRHMLRISTLPAEIGEELDRAGAGLGRARYVAYGRTRIEQCKRLKSVLAELAPKGPAPVPLQTELETGPALVRALGVRLPDALKNVPAATVDAFVREVIGPDAAERVLRDLYRAQKKSAA